MENETPKGDGNLLVNEIFLSVQGESTFAGLPCVFVRLTGCPLRCTWCDTSYAYSDGIETSLTDVVRQVLDYGINLVEVTGGEPLAQASTLELLTMLCDHGLTVLLETSGAFDITQVNGRVHIILDLKCPSSRMTEKMYWENLGTLQQKDELKLVIEGRADYEFARELIIKRQLNERCTVLLSPVYDRLDPRNLVAWLLEDRLPVRFQLQMQKYIWSPETRGV